MVQALEYGKGQVAKSGTEAINKYFLKENKDSQKQNSHSRSKKYAPILVP